MTGPKKHSNPTMKTGPKKQSDSNVKPGKKKQFEPGRESIISNKSDSVTSTASNRSTKSVRIDEGYGAGKGSADTPQKSIIHKNVSILRLTNQMSLSGTLTPPDEEKIFDHHKVHINTRDELPPINKLQNVVHPDPCMERNYSCQTIGYHPRPDCVQFHIKRKDPLTKQVKMVPKMIHNLEANRAKMPEHQLIEDDWRAYRSVLHNRTKAKMATLPADQQREKFLRDSVLAGHCLGINVDATTLFKQSEDFIRNNNGRLELTSYKGAVVSPVGYMYRRYTDEKAKKHQQRTIPVEARRNSCPEAERLPLVVASNPFNQFHVSEEQRGDISNTHKECRSHDVDNILLADMPEHITVYNEPDSIPGSVLYDDFTKTLAERTQIAIDLPKAPRHGTVDSKILGQNRSSFFLPFPPRNSRVADRPQRSRSRTMSQVRPSFGAGLLPNIDELLMQTCDILERRHKNSHPSIVDNNW